MNKTILSLAYGVKVLDLSSAEKPLQVLLIQDFEDKSKLNVCSPNGLHRQVFNIGSLESENVRCDYHGLKMSITLGQRTWVYKFASLVDLERFSDSLHSIRVLDFTLSREQQYHKKLLAELKEEISSNKERLSTLSHLFLAIFKHSLDFGSEPFLGTNIPQLQFESIIKTCFRNPDYECWSEYLKQCGFVERYSYGVTDIATFLFNEELNCEYNFPLRPSVF